MVSSPCVSQRNTAARYRIRVAGALGEEWGRRVQDMVLSVRRGDPTGTVTELVGELADEASLMGVLNTLYAYGARLLSVEHIGIYGTNGVEGEVRGK